MEKMKTFEELNGLILDWAKERDLLTKDNSTKQYLKFIEEAGEVARGILKKDEPAIIDGIGDVLVTLIILSNQLGLDPVHCLKMAYNEIKDRKGQTAAPS